MGKSLFIGVLVLTVIFAAITITVQRHSSKVPEMLSENLAEQRAANLAAYALSYGIKQIDEEKVQKTQIPIIGEGYFTQNFTDFNVLNGTIDSLRYTALDADKDAIKIIANVTAVVGADTVHHKSETTLDNVIDYHPDEQVGCWSFDEGSGTTAADGSDSGNDGTLGGGDSAPDWTTDTAYGDGALYFDGNNDRVDLDTLVSSTYDDVLTITCWTKLDPSFLDWGVLVAEQTNEGSWPVCWSLRARIFDIWIYKNVKYAFDVVTNSGVEEVSISKDNFQMDVYAWHFIVGTYDGTYSETQAEISIQIYDEGYKNTKLINKWTRRDPTNTVSIGGRETTLDWFGPFTCIDAILDEVGLYDEILSDDVLDQLYQFNGVKKTEIIYWQE